MIKQPTYDQLFKDVNNVSESMKIYRALVNNSQDLLYRTDLHGCVTYASPSIYALTGHTVEEAIGRNMAEDGYVFPEERERFLKLLQKSGQVNNYEAQLKRKDGSIWWGSTNAHLYKDKAGNVIGVEGITRDITELKRAEEALRKSEERFRLTFHTSPDAITLSKASDGKFVDVNEGFTKNIGYTREESIGKTSFALNIWKNSGDRKRLISALTKNGRVENLELEFSAKDGSIIIGLLSARFMTIDDETIMLSIIRNITEHKKLEQQLYQANKLQALGTLAGGIAHNFNNLLMSIAGHASLIESEEVSKENTRARIQGIEVCVRSASDLTKQLLGLARGGKYEIRAIDINELLVDSANMFGRTRKEIQIHTTLYCAPVVVNVDKNQIEQVLLNLFVNAWQAMPEGGDLFIETSIATLDEAYCQPHNLNPGRYCKLSVADTGIGMDEETRHCAFDPFFTTKDKECGTGLGLASVYGIVKNHGGIVHVLSEPNCGATFNIYLPLSTEDTVKKIVTNEKILKGRETILLVDDEPMVLNVAKSMLEKLGYDVLVSNNGPEAIDLVKKGDASVGLVILDLIMPGMDGGKTFDHLRELQPDLPVLLSSGYALDGHVLDIMDRGCNGFIQKPFGLSLLSQKIRKILDQAKQNTAMDI